MPPDTEGDQCRAINRSVNQFTVSKYQIILYNVIHKRKDAWFQFLGQEMLGYLISRHFFDKWDYSIEDDPGY